GFKLPGDGGTLILVNGEGEEIDRVTYESQLENISYGRYQDGVSAFVHNAFPSPGRANLDNGSVMPEAAFSGYPAGEVTSGQPLRFEMTGVDDIGILNASVIYRRVDQNGFPDQRVILFDDGMNEDRELSDGFFAGKTALGFPSGSEIQYYLEVTDLTGNVMTIPDGAGFAEDPGESVAFSLGIDLRQGLEISEVVANNRGVAFDEFGGSPDYIEVRNVSEESISLGGLSLAKDPFDEMGEWYRFSDEAVLEPGEYVLVYADANVAQGESHAPFKIQSDGDHVYLLAVGITGVPSVVDAIGTPALGRDEAFARIGDQWVVGPASPEAGSLSQPVLELTTKGSGERIAHFAFPIPRGKRHEAQFSETLKPGSWEVLRTVEGNGAEVRLSKEIGARGYFRVRSTE
ncbi:MAG: lamin tail domain-containing protein, partial [Verrucomicrobiota bacterium]